MIRIIKGDEDESKNPYTICANQDYIHLKDHVYLFDDSGYSANDPLLGSFRVGAPAYLKNKEIFEFPNENTRKIWRRIIKLNQI